MSYPFVCWDIASASGPVMRMDDSEEIIIFLPNRGYWRAAATAGNVSPHEGMYLHTSEGEK
jgi:hypothetical protein